MSEVIAERGETERRIVSCEWYRAKQHAKRALDRGWKVRIRTFYADVLVAQPNGDFLIIARKASPRDAAKFSILWSKRDERARCAMWPHGRANARWVEHCGIKSFAMAYSKIKL